MFGLKSSVLFTALSVLAPMSAYADCDMLAGTYRLSDKNNCEFTGDYLETRGDLILPTDGTYIGTLPLHQPLQFSQQDCQSVKLEYQSSTFGGNVSTELVGQEVSRKGTFGEDKSLTVKTNDGNIFTSGYYAQAEWDFKIVGDELEIKATTSTRSIFFPGSRGSMTCKLARD